MVPVEAALPPTACHVYVNGPALPFGIAVALPSAPPKQVTGVDVTVTEKGAVEGTTTGVTRIQLFASATVIL